jgi:RNA polymerase sigma-70 factor, ECF subfamily
MSNQQATIGNFHTDLKAILPRLRSYALSLTRDSDRADNLMHRTVVKALTGRKSFQPGTNFPGWLFRIQRNEFISGLRSLRPTVTLDDTIANGLSHEPRQESGIIMREFKKAFYALSSCQRETLLLAVLEGCSYERIAAHSGVSVGTVKSRVSRARATLKQILADEGSNASRRTSSDTRIFARHLQQHAGDHAAAAD